MLCYHPYMDKTVVNVELRGEDITLLEHLKVTLAIKGDSASNAAALRYALRMAARKAK